MTDDRKTIRFEELDPQSKQTVQKIFEDQITLSEQSKKVKELKQQLSKRKDELMTTVRSKTRKSVIVIEYKDQRILVEKIKGRLNPVSRDYITTFLKTKLKGVKVDDIVDGMFHKNNRGYKADEFKVHLHKAGEGPSHAGASVHKSGDQLPQKAQEAIAKVKSTVDQLPKRKAPEALESAATVAKKSKPAEPIKTTAVKGN